MNNKLFTSFLLIGISVLLFASCTKNLGTQQKTMDEVVIYPTPPDTGRIQYLTSITNSQQIVGTRSRFAKYILGKKPVGSIKKPYGVSIRNGKLYICDPGMGGIEIIDFKKNTFDYFMPGGLGQFRFPMNCAVDENDFLYVADPGRQQIVIFDEEGEYVSAFGDTGQFKPTDVFLKDGKVWVPDMKSHRINVYSKDSTNKLLYYFPKEGIGRKGKLFMPTNVHVTDKYVYACDGGDYKIKKYTHEGEFISAVGSQGTGIGQFARPKGIAVDRESTLFVVDAMFENVQMFNDKGQLLMFFGGHYAGPGGLWLPTYMSIDYDNLEYFEKYVHPNYKLKYLIFVVSQFGPDKINIYGAIEPNK